MTAHQLLPLALLSLLACKDGPVDTGQIGDSDPGVVDQDGDGDGVPLEEDCDDNNPEVFPGNVETPYDGLDNDCDPSTPDDDLDGDGFLEAEDCDDADPERHPEAEEVCDGVDQDCDGEVDDGVASTFYADVDGDGYGDLESPQQACEQPEGFVEDSSDCDDTTSEAYPGHAEICDELDNNCDGEVDEGVTTTFFGDLDSDGYGDPDLTVEACAVPTGFAATADDCDDSQAAIHPGATELCNGLDDDCDGDTDEDDAADAGTWYADADGDSYGDPNNASVACEAPSGTVADDQDCDDSDAGLNPDTVWYLDFDADGYGGSTYSLTQCAQPNGYILDASDCDDTEAAAYPGATEVCDGVDNDCDGDVDGGAVDVSAWYDDLDGDGYGDASAVTMSCEAPSGAVSDNQDCDDTDANINPATVWYLDFDADGYGGSTYTLTQCAQPNGYILDSSDCDDSEATAYPGASELCDGLDNDCDGDVDGGAVDASAWYDDLDGDGYGDASAVTMSCEAPSAAVSDDTDCDDGDAGVNPGAAELCDGVDTDCDGDVDEDEEVLGEDAACAASSCLDIVTARTNSPADDSYWIDAGAGPFEVQCDMSVDGGGWTLQLVEESQSIPAYGNAWYTSTTPQGSLADLTTTYKSDVYGDLDFEEVLYVVFPDTDDTDRIEVVLDFATTIAGMDDAFSTTRSASSATQVSGTLAVQAPPYTWAFRASCSSYGGGAVMLGAGHGNTCNIFYGFGCTGGTYCGVSDFHATWMASNTNRLFPSGDRHDTFGDVVQIWVR